MNRVSLPTTLWSDPRFVSLQELTGWGRAETVGTLVLLWDATRRKDSPEIYTHDSLLTQLIGGIEARQRSLKALIEAGYVSSNPKGELRLPDNSPYYRHIHMLKEAGRRGGKARGANTVKAKPKTAKEQKNLTPNAQRAHATALAAYTEAYKERYAVAPVMNAKLHKQLNLFIQRVGQDDAPEVIRFYVYHPNGYYLRRQHNLDCLLADAEGLRTQWKTKTTITNNDVRRVEAQDRLASQVREFEAQARGTIAP